MIRPTTSDGPFVGRAAELALLESAWAGRESAFIPIYGRRRIGKSELILQFTRDKRAIYHLGKVAPAQLQIREFLAEAARALDEPLLAQLAPTDWRAAFDAIETRTKDGKLALVLDEFQWTAGASPELPSLLQELWDRRWKRGGRIVLILCGSFIGFMEREVLGKRSPLFGRRTAQIHLQPFGYREAGLFHRRWSIENRARAYFVCGGIPMYLKTFDEGRSLQQNIEGTLLSELAPLFREPEFLLREELRDVENYHAVLHAIAAGSTTTSTLAATSGLPQRSLHYYLEQLVQLGYVARRHPLTAARPNARLVRFVLEDPLLRFWFRFVFPHRSFIQQMGPTRAYTDLIKPNLDSYFGGCFERMCREALPSLYEAEGVHTTFRIGEYWDKRVQIDLVGVREDAWIDLGECKWGPIGSTRAVVDELETKVRGFPNVRGDTIGRRIFARTVPASAAGRDGPTALRWHSLESLYEDPEPRGRRGTMRT
ncbi:MAG TPA: ATP-binding protein [Kofleriaceae bacterium]|jgi:AAA+ ATPase superfamily predicted ATPase|nr:ATP-binding protein [Kofleriaceae bacterium]